MADSFYKVIKGVKYDRSILNRADELIKGQGDGRISRDDIRLLFEETKDGPGITETEYKTLDYIADNYNMTDAAREWLKSALKGHKPAFSESSTGGGTDKKRKGMPQWLKILLIILIILIIIIILLCLSKSCTARDTTVSPAVNTNEVVKQNLAESPQEKTSTQALDSGIYTVKQGDRLTDIGYRFYSNKNDWILIYRENKAQIEDEDIIQPGQKFIIPQK